MDLLLEVGRNLHFDGSRDVFRWVSRWLFVVDPGSGLPSLLEIQCVQKVLSHQRTCTYYNKVTRSSMEMIESCGTEALIRQCSEVWPDGTTLTDLIVMFARKQESQFGPQKQTGEPVSAVSGALVAHTQNNTICGRENAEHSPQARQAR